MLLSGVLAGIIAGIFGLGGGILFTPILYYLFVKSGLPDPAVWAIATSLFCTFIASTGSSIQQGFQHNAFLKEGFMVGITGSAGIYLGKIWVTSDYFTEELFVVLFSVILLMVAILFFYKSRKKLLKAGETEGEMTTLKSVSSGAFGGFVASIAGVGGGIVLVPMMNLLYRIRLSKAISISSFAIVLISLSGWFQYAFLSGKQSGLTPYTLGFVDFGTAFPLIIGAFAGGFAGVRAGLYLSARLTQILFAALIVIIVITMIRTLMVQ